MPSVGGVRSGRVSTSFARARFGGSSNSYGQQSAYGQQSSGQHPAYAQQGVHDLGATQSLQLNVRAAQSDQSQGGAGTGGQAHSGQSTISSLGLNNSSGAMGGAKSMWRLPPVAQSMGPSSASNTPAHQNSTGAPAGASKLQLEHGVGNIPHPAKMATGGEDANFTSPHACGVADGVGGWAAHGIDAGEYARGLMTNAKEAVEIHGQTDPLAVLWHAYRGVTHLGSSTCLILTLDNDRSVLHSANLGTN